MKFLKATFLLALTGFFVVLGIIAARFAFPTRPGASYTSNMWSLVQDQVPRKELVVLEEQVVETHREHWKTSPPWWKVPFGDWPGDAAVRIDAPARIYWAVPLDADWSYSIVGPELVIRPPDLQVLSVDIDSDHVNCVYEKTAARWNEYEMEQKLRLQMRERIARNAQSRKEAIRRKAEGPIVEFFDQYVLQTNRHLDPALPRRVVWDSDPSLAQGGR